MNNSVKSDKPCENIYWPKGRAPRGHYKVKVNHYKNNGGQDPTSYLVIVELHGKSIEFRDQIKYGDEPHIWEFDV